LFLWLNLTKYVAYIFKYGIIKLYGEDYMAFEDKYDFQLLKNEAEVLVIREMEKQLQNKMLEMCKCNDCMVDVAAIALNSIKPLYRFSLLGALYTAQAMNEKAYGESVKQAVTEAIYKVRKNPSHD